MPKFTLYKLSAPGWTKKFPTESAMRDELFQYICSHCRAEEGITKNSSAGDMLSTACGCEFDLDEK